MYLGRSRAWQRIIQTIWRSIRGQLQGHMVKPKSIVINTIQYEKLERIDPRARSSGIAPVLFGWKTKPPVIARRRRFPHTIESKNGLQHSTKSFIFTMSRNLSIILSYGGSTMRLHHVGPQLENERPIDPMGSRTRPIDHGSRDHRAWECCAWLAEWESGTSNRLSLPRKLDLPLAVFDPFLLYAWATCCPWF